MKPVKHVPNKDVAARYGVVVRTVENWLADRSLGFPRPIVINGRKYYIEHELDEFDRRAPRSGAGEAKAA